MAVEVVKLPGSDRPPFFRPAATERSHAILVDVLEHDREARGWEGKHLEHGALTARITAFRTPESLEAGTPDFHEDAMIIEHQVVVDQLSEYLGRAVVVTIEQKPTADLRPYWCAMPVKPEVTAKVAEWARTQDAVPPF